MIKEGFARELRSVDVDFLEAAVLVHGDAAVEEKVAVLDVVERAVAEEESDVLLELLGIQHRGLQSLHHFYLIRRERVGIFRIHRREIGGIQLPGLSVGLDRPLLQIHLVQEESVFKFKLRVILYHLAFDLELDDRDGLMHAGFELVVDRVEFVHVQNVRPELLAVVVAVCRLGKGGEPPHVDPVAQLQHVHVVVADVHADQVGYACPVARRGSHPDHVVVAPLEIHVVEIHEIVHNVIRVRSTVKDIAYDVEVVHRQHADRVRHAGDEGLSEPLVYDVIDDLAVVVCSVLLVVGVEQLVHCVGEMFGESLTHPGPGVFGRYGFADGDEPVDHGHAPFVKVFFALAAAPDLCFGVVDQGREVVSVFLAQDPAVVLVDLVFDRSGGAPDHVDEGFVLAVQVAQEVFGAFRQRQDRLQVDVLRRRGKPVRVPLSEELQIFAVRH